MTLAEYIKIHKIPSSANWIYYDDGDKTDTIYYSDYFKLSKEEQEAIRISNAILTYKNEAEQECTLNQYQIDKYKTLKSETVEMIKKINTLVLAYRYDESNTMVDYFDANFYYDIVIKPETK